MTKNLRIHCTALDWQVKSSVGLLKRLRAESPPEGAVVTPALKFMDVFSK